jgi:hypothetical protein
MRITRRIIDAKQHTVGFVLSDGRRVDRAQAVGLALEGSLTGVRVVNGNPRYIMSTTSRSLYDLPEAQESTVSSSASSSSSSSRSRSSTARRSSRRRTASSR